MGAILTEKKQNRETFDAHSSDRSACFEKLKLLMGNGEVLINHPQGWEEAIDRKNSNFNIPYNEMWDQLDPNDIDDIEYPWLTKEIELLYRSTRKLYKEAYRKWTMDTGGGPNG